MQRKELRTDSVIFIIVGVVLALGVVLTHDWLLVVAGGALIVMGIGFLLVM